MGPNGEEVETACIVTTAANRTLAPIHDRMPVVIAPEAFDLWLNCAHVDATTAAALIAPASDDLFEAYEISTAANRAANDSPELIAPVGPPSPDSPARTEGKRDAAPARAAPARRAKAKPNEDDGQMSLL